MIIERVVFKMKYGKTEEGLKLWAELSEVLESMTDEAKTYGVNTSKKMRMLVRISGSTDVIVNEINVSSYNEMNPMAAMWGRSPKIQEIYRRFVLLCESSSREMYKIEASI